MIKNSQSVSMAEATKYINKKESAETLAFIGKFASLKADKAGELRKNLAELDLIKLNDLHITKIIDILPEDSEDLNKIFSDVSLDEDETKKILETVKPYK